MAQFITMIAVGKWANRESLQFVPVNNKVNNKRYNAYGVQIVSAGDPAEVRRPYRMEENGGTTYVMYDDDSFDDVPIYKTVEA